MSNETHTQQMYTLRRVTTGTQPIRVMVTRPDGEAGEAFNSGGTFYFNPAGEDGDTFQLPEWAAKQIMADPGIANHFTVTPRITKAELADAAPKEAEPDNTSGPETGESVDGEGGSRRRKSK